MWRKCSRIKRDVFTHFDSVVAMFGCSLWFHREILRGCFFLEVLHCFSRHLLAKCTVNICQIKKVFIISILKVVSTLKNHVLYVVFCMKYISRMPLPAKLPATSGKTLTSLSAEKTDVLANRYFIQTTLGSGNCGTALLVEDRKDKDGKEKLLVLWGIMSHFAFMSL